MVKLLATRALSKVHSPTDAVCNFITFGRFFFFQIIWCMLCLIITDLTVHVNLLFQLDRNKMSFFTSQQFLIKPNNGAHHNPNFVAKKSTQPNRITSSFPPAHSLTLSHYRSLSHALCWLSAWFPIAATTNCSSSSSDRTRLTIVSRRTLWSRRDVKDKFVYQSLSLFKVFAFIVTFNDDCVIVIDISAVRK